MTTVCFHESHEYNYKLLVHVLIGRPQDANDDATTRKTPDYLTIGIAVVQYVWVRWSTDWLELLDEDKITDATRLQM